ncbi:peptide chain release factor 1 [Roseomonas nepalensis]|uniref:Peptide chain release factor 1 n=1 Tax=Muricoccus nepalensis TaxID=1854500 RepID=A0A502GDD3_9PROT|nr:peptide chain release factor 1 [Roseomonas nepalensis]TPG59518.1 peptide chain release factor 1 [Roseomonas nepalensis]
MTEMEMERAQAELDRLLNDPDVRMDPERVWTLADHLSRAAARTAPATR